jgi:acetyltransferase
MMLSSKYMHEVLLKGRVQVLLRPIQREDGSEMGKYFMESLALESSTYNRFFGYIRYPSPKMIESFCNVDYETQMGFVAEMFGVHEPIETKWKRIIGVGRLAQTMQKRAELAVVVAREYQHLGIGSKLTEILIEFAKEKKFASVYAIIPPDNYVAIRIATRYGFQLLYSDQNMVVVERFIQGRASKVPVPQEFQKIV